MNVLVLDDEPESLAAMAAYLEKLDGVTVVAFGDAAAAAGWLAGNQADLVLVDSSVSGANGLDVIRDIRDTTPEIDLPMVILTGNDDPQLLNEAIDAGANDFVRKPVVGPELLARTRNMLNLRARTRVLLQIMARLQEQATTDSLTQTMNRRCFLERLDAEFGRAQRHRHPLSVLLLDIDHFKAVNDTFGHAAGDAVLESFAAECRLQLRMSDFMGRIGGEEFAVGLPHTPADGAGILAERMRVRIAATVIEHEGRTIGTTVSIGVGTIAPGDGAKSLLARADSALYAAKREGRNRVVVASAPGPDATETARAG